MYEQVRKGIMRKAKNNYWRDRFERLKTENQALKERRLPQLGAMNQAFTHAEDMAIGPCGEGAGGGSTIFILDGQKGATWF